MSAIIYGSIDGLITTNAIITSIQGAQMKSTLAIIFGFANLLADGFSMGVSSYLSSDQIAEGIKTFLSFILIGSGPIMPFLFKQFTNEKKYMISHVITITSLFFIGIFKGYIKNENMIKHALIVVFIGGLTTMIAYYVSKYIHEIVDKEDR